MLDLLKRFVGEERGLEMVEWAIVAALITTASAFTMRAIGVFVNANFSILLLTLQRAG
jgi:Flp pilus assembly pilin Flp